MADSKAMHQSSTIRNNSYLLGYVAAVALGYDKYIPLEGMEHTLATIAPALWFAIKSTQGRMKADEDIRLPKLPKVSKLIASLLIVCSLSVGTLAVSGCSTTGSQATQRLSQLETEREMLLGQLQQAEAAGDMDAVKSITLQLEVNRIEREGVEKVIAANPTGGDPVRTILTLGAIAFGMAGMPYVSAGLEVIRRRRDDYTELVKADEPDPAST